jgi:hypothetical protein
VNTDAPPRGSLHVGTLVVIAVLVGVVVALAAQRFAGGSCPGGPEPEGLFASSCGELIANLAWRVGAMAGGAVLLFGLIGKGLERTAARVQEERRILADEAPDDRAGPAAR